MILGILMILFLWPQIAYETKGTFDINDLKGNETVRYVGKVTHKTQAGEIYVLELDEGVIQVYTRDESIEAHDTVFVTIKFGANVTRWDENSYTVEKIPTFGGTLGAFIFIVGLIVTIWGLSAKKLTVEDVIHFKVEPAPTQPMQIQPKVGDAAQGQITTTSQEPTDAVSQTQKMVHVTCPGCGKVFGFLETDSPEKIKCPECGLEGRIN